MKVFVALILTWFTDLHGNKGNGIWAERWRKNSKQFHCWNYAKNKNFASLASRPQQPGMTSPLRKLLADCFKTFSLSGRPKTGLSAACHLYILQQLDKVVWTVSFCSVLLLTKPCIKAPVCMSSQSRCTWSPMFETKLNFTLIASDIIGIIIFIIYYLCKLRPNNRIFH